jgi:hypothetical protein
VSEGLLRVTAVAGSRRSDLAVPDGVALAELVPDLARAVGLLDPAAAYAGYRVQAHGRRLRPDQGLREQGVGDGALLAVAATSDQPPPASYDDLVEATADTVREQPAWRPAATRRATLAAGLAAVVAGLGVAVLDAVRQAAADWSSGAPTAVAAVTLVLVVLAGNALPALAVAVGVGRAGGQVVDPDRVDGLVRRSGRVLVAGSAAVGVLAALAVPLVATSGPGAVLVLTCAGVLLLRARRHRALGPALADVLAGLGVVAATAATLVVHRPADRTAVAVALFVGGCVACAATRLPVGTSALRARSLDVVETLALVALAPELLLATDGLAAVAGA